MMALRFEPLEERLAFSVWQNADLPCDVDRSGLVSPIDLLQVINEINHSGHRSLSEVPPQLGQPVDTDGDGVLGPDDMWGVINLINRYSEPMFIVIDSPAEDRFTHPMMPLTNLSVRGWTQPQMKVSLSLDGSELDTVDADAHGRFEINAATWHILEGTVVVTTRDPRGRTSTAGFEILSEVSDGDPILLPPDVSSGWYHLDRVVPNWNALALHAVRNWQAVDGAGRVVRSPPPMVARNLAMIHAAMFDAANAYDAIYEPYIQGLPQPPEGSSPYAAAAAAAHTVISSLYPSAAEKAMWDAALDGYRIVIDDDAAWEASEDFGRLVGEAVLQLRSDDGSADPGEYTHGGDPGDWQKTLPGYLPASLPQWPDVLPFSLPSLEEFQAPAFPPLASDVYADTVDEVMRLGAIDSSERTADQTAIAYFWAAGGGTVTPPGQWNRIATEIAADRAMSLVDTARLFAALNLAMADAGIAAWDAKYTYDLWRPIDAIRRASEDGNLSTESDVDWTPLLGTPPFPSYVSGHSTFSGAAAAVLTAMLGEGMAFSIASDPLDNPPQHLPPGGSSMSRSFGSFREAAQEAGMSRIYGGIHFDFDNTAGLDLGEAIGQYVVANFLRPV